MINSQPVSEVKVSNWRNPRKIVISPASITLQVTSGSCNCATCMGRIVSLRRTLAEKPTIEHAWVQMDCGGHYLIMPRPGSEDPLKHIAQVLEVEVSISG